MTTLRQAAQQALEALETKGEHHPRVYAAINALRTALAQPSTAPARYSRKEINEFEQMEDGTWEADRNG